MDLFSAVRPFQDPEVEQRFLASYAQRSMRHLRALGAGMVGIGSLCAAACLLAAPSAAHDPALSSAVLRMTVMSGALALSGPLLWLLSRQPWFVPRHERVLAVVMVAGVPGMFFPFVDAPHALAVHGYVFFVLHVVNVHTLMRLRFYSAATVGTLVTVAYLACAALLLELHVAELALQGVVLAAANGYGLFTSYRFELAARSDFTKTAEVEAQRDKADALLENVLPRSVAARLKAGEQGIADGFEQATVLFADLVGFTDFAARVPPGEVVERLNQLFSSFDELTERHGLEKIKTIGDSYMVAGGLPHRSEDHPDAVAHLALAMLGVAERSSLGALRIGIHCGPVVAGVIGTHKFAYDLWGDAVNTASRMESHGAPGRIQVTEAVRDLLGNRFVLEQRGPIAVKGKGEMTTWWLCSARQVG